MNTFLETLGTHGNILKMARLGHPVLAQKTELIDPKSALAQETMRDMAATLTSYLGGFTGLAAPQVHLSRRICFYMVDKNRSDEHCPGGIAPRFLINATYEPITDETINQIEGCLSMPGLVGCVKRYQGIRVTGFLSDGHTATPIEYEAWGYHARVLQHEIDHLDGVLYLQRLCAPNMLAYMEEAKAYWPLSKHRPSRCGEPVS